MADMIGSASAPAHSQNRVGAAQDRFGRRGGKPEVENRCGGQVGDDPLGHDRHLGRPSGWVIGPVSAGAACGVF
ncbi:MAG: hypothetical protein ACRDRA_17505 [Pseudonocardiaceae bacterium]